jgi:hypothetical protein
VPPGTSATLRLPQEYQTAIVGRAVEENLRNGLKLDAGDYQILAK